jgi:hypothetical protein
MARADDAVRPVTLEVEEISPDRRTNEAQGDPEVLLAIVPAPTESGVDEVAGGTEMIRELGPRISRFTADGAYDTGAIYETLAATMPRTMPMSTHTNADRLDNKGPNSAMCPTERHRA